MSEKKGIKELSEAVSAATVLAMKLVKLSKDGIDLADLAALMADGELHDMIGLAVQGASSIPEEVKDLDAAEAIQLAAVVVPKIIAGLK
jgi:hypothetical protein